MTSNRVAHVCALAITVVLAFCGVASAAEPTSLLGQPPTRWGIPSGFAVTRLGQATFSQNLVTVGQTVTETLTLNSPAGNQTAGWSWQVPAGFTVVSGCGDGNYENGTGDYQCVLKATSPTQMQTPACGSGSGGNTVQYLSGGCYNNWTVTPTIYIDNSQGTGVTDDYYAILPSGQYAIQGQVLGQDGPPKSTIPITITASGGGSASAQTDTQGQYGPVTLNQDPAVTVSADGYVASNCPGTLNSDGSCTVNLNRSYSINFKPPADFILSGTISGPSGAGVSGDTVAISGPQNATATTDSSGDFSVEDLPRGTYTVTVQPKGTAFPVSSTDCTAQNLSCTVLLNQDRDVTFTGCVVPNPNGSPLPAGTPASIPGAVTTGSLEAVGCWAPPADGTSNYTSTGPVRLDGLDVKPADGTTITLNKTTRIVTSDGPVSLMIGGSTISSTSSLDLDYSGTTVVSGVGGFFSASGFGSSQAVGGFANLFGLPFLFNAGISKTGALPWATTAGSTVLTYNVGVPSSLISKWVPSTQQYVFTSSAAGATNLPGLATTVTKSVMLNGTATLTNRDGLQNPNICGTLGSDPAVAPWGPTKPQIKSLQLCYDAAIGQWTGTGAVQIPTSATVPPVTVTGSLSFIGYNLSNGSLKGSNINKQIGDGVVLQSIGASYTPDLALGIASKLTGTATVSFGPKLSFPKLGTKFTNLQAATATGTLSLQMASSPQVYSLSGNVMLLPDTPFAYKLGDASVTYTSGSSSLSPTQVLQLGSLGPGGLTAGEVQALATGKLDFTGTLSLSNSAITKPLGLGENALNISVAGYYNYQQGAVQFTGSTTYTILHQTVTLTVLSNTTTLGLCDQINKYAVGLIYSYITGRVTTAAGECNLTPLTGTQTTTTLKPARAAAAHAAGSARTLQIARGLNGVTFAVRGGRSAPKVRLTGRGLTLKTGIRTTMSSKAFVYHVGNTTYIALSEPAGGTYHLTALKGSAPIHAVLEQLPSAPPKISGKVDGTSCERVLRYSYRAVRGRKVALYAVDADQRQFLGYAKSPAGVLAFTPTQGAVGSGTVEADTIADGLPAATKKLGTFATKATDPASAPTSVARSGDELFWSVGCGAASYRVTLTHGKTSRVLNLSDTSTKLPAGLRGQVKVTIASLDASGTAGGTLSRTLAA
jgi:hypothetical protein